MSNAYDHYMLGYRIFLESTFDVINFHTVHFWVVFQHVSILRHLKVLLKHLTLHSKVKVVNLAMINPYNSTLLPTLQNMETTPPFVLQLNYRFLFQVDLIEKSKLKN